MFFFFQIFQDVALAMEKIKCAISGDPIEPINAEVKKMRLEFYDIYTTPDFKEDRAKLKHDRNAVSSDYKKVVDSKKLELQY